MERKTTQIQPPQNSKLQFYDDKLPETKAFFGRRALIPV
jgi:hypothetical protein